MRGGPCSLFGNPRVYIAAPIFTPEQLASVDAVVSVLEAVGFITYSPARDGVMLQPTDPPARRDEVFYSNVAALRQVDALVAILDTKDTGTIWELGMATARDIPIIAVTLTVPKMNVMLERGVLAHVRSLQDLDNVAGELQQFLIFGRKVTAGWMNDMQTFQDDCKGLYSYSGETQ